MPLFNWTVERDAGKREAETGGTGQDRPVVFNMPKTGYAPPPLKEYMKVTYQKGTSGRTTRASHLAGLLIPMYLHLYFTY